MIFGAPRQKDAPFRPIPTEGRFELSTPNISKHGEVGARVLRGRAALHGSNLQDPRNWDAMLLDPGQTKGVGRAQVPSNGREWAQQDTVTTGMTLDDAPAVVGKKATSQLYKSGNVQTGGVHYGAYKTTGDPAKDRAQHLEAMLGRTREWMRDTDDPRRTGLTISREGVLGRAVPPAVLGGQTGGSSRPSYEASAWKDDGLFSDEERQGGLDTLGKGKS